MNVKLAFKRKPTYIFAAVAHWFRHWSLMTEVVGASPVIGHFLFLFAIFNVQTNLVNRNSQDL